MLRARRNRAWLSFVSAGVTPYPKREATLGREPVAVGSKPGLEHHVRVKPSAFNVIRQCISTCQSRQRACTPGYLK
jgi:hypothetical protein